MKEASELQGVARQHVVAVGEKRRDITDMVEKLSALLDEAVNRSSPGTTGEVAVEWIGVAAERNKEGNNGGTAVESSACLGVEAPDGRASERAGEAGRAVG